MNKNFIAGAIFLCSTAACLIVKRKADRQYLTKKAAELVANEKSKSDILAYDEAKKAIKTRTEVLAREKKDLKESFDAWKKKNRIDQRKKDLYFAEDKAIQDFKNSLGYGDAIADIERQKQESIDAFKASIDYSDKIDELKKTIKDAENKWEEQQRIFASTDDSISDVASKLKHAAEDAKDATIKQAKTDIAELEKKLKAEEDIWDKKIQKSRREFEEKVNGEKNRLAAKTKADLASIDAEVDLAYKDISRDIQSRRTDEEFDAVSFYEDNCKLVRTQDDIDQLKAIDIFQETPRSERLAWWFNEHKWPKWSVAGLGFTPLLAAEWLLSCYGRFVIDILKAM